MKNKFKHQLKQGLKELPLHTPDAKQWERIEGFLDLDEAISRETSLLPEYEPDARVWEAVAKKMPTSGNPWRLRRLSQVAAAAVLVLAVAFSWSAIQNRGYTIEKEKLLSESLTPSFYGEEEEDPIRIIESLCKSGAPVCKTEDFTEKLSLYTELNQELLRLDKVIRQLGESPEIISAQIKIENMKSDTIKELMGLIHS